MFGFEIVTLPKFTLDTTTIKKIFSITEKKIDKVQKGVLNIVFVSSDEIRELNKNYRGKDYSTDVLSFHYYDDFEIIKDDEIAGELVFCEDEINSQAEEFGLGNEKEFYKLLIHSVLHILGFDHEIDIDYEKMNKFEDEIWKEIF